MGCFAVAFFFFNFLFYNSNLLNNFDKKILIVVFVDVDVNYLSSSLSLFFMVIIIYSLFLFDHLNAIFVFLF